MNAHADTQEFSIGVGTQLCTKEDPTTEYCSAAEMQTTREKLDLEGNEPWFKKFLQFSARVIIKKRTDKYIVRLDIYSDEGKSLAHYATEVKSLQELTTMKLGSAFVAISETSSVRGWLRVSLP